MGSFRLVGNTLAIAYLAARLKEDGHHVSWCSSGYLAPLRPIRLRSESFDSLGSYFRRRRFDAAFLGRSPKLGAWASIRDGGPQVKLWSDLDEGFEDRWVEGGEVFRALKACAVAAGVELVEPTGAIPNPLLSGGTDLIADNIFIVSDVCQSETRLWPRAISPHSNSLALRSKGLISVASFWFPQFAVTREGAGGFLFGDWKMCRLILEPHPNRGFVLTLVSTTTYAIERALKDICNPKIAGLSELRALYVFNGQRFSEERFQMRPALSQEPLVGAFAIGRSIGVFGPVSNLQDDWALREVEHFLVHCDKQQSKISSTDASRWRLVSEWNQGAQMRFESEWRRSRLWERLLFTKTWGRHLLRASRYLPKTLRERMQLPA